MLAESECSNKIMNTLYVLVVFPGLKAVFRRETPYVRQCPKLKLRNAKGAKGDKIIYFYLNK